MLNVISLVVAVLSVIGLLFSLRQSNRARLRQFEERYVERYWSILDALSLEALSGLGQRADRDDQLAIRRYILLCEDELQLRKNGYISDPTFEEWASGMIEQFGQPMFAAVWEDVKKGNSVGEKDDAPYQNLDRLLQAKAFKSGGPGDPLTMGVLTRMARGLKVLRGA